MPAPVFRPRRTLQLLTALGIHGALLAAQPPGLSARPLAPHAETPPATLFATLSPAQTGIVTENSYADPRMWTDRYHEFDCGAIGSGVAIGDYDGDGLPDVFIVSKIGPCRLFRNLGHWKFEDVTEKAGLAHLPGALQPGAASAKSLDGKEGAENGPIEEWKQGATFVDVNNDGRLDIFVCRFAAPNWLFINQGNGTFKEEAGPRGLAISDACGMASFCDYDRDGWLDVYIQTNLLSSEHSPDGQRDYLFHNSGDGTFTNVTDRADRKSTRLNSSH